MAEFIEAQRKKHDAGLCEMMLNVQKNAQRTKLDSAREKGRLGWETASLKELRTLLDNALAVGDWISVANYAGMLYCHGLADTTDVLDGPTATRPEQLRKGAGSPPRTHGRGY